MTARPKLTLRALEPKEREVQSGILHLLALMPSVSWAMRVNSGRWAIVRPPGGTDGWRRLHAQLSAAVAAGTFSRSQVGWVEGAPLGCPDIIGQMAGSGEMLGIEVKRPGKKPTVEQQHFLERINREGGLGIVASDIQQVPRLIAEWKVNQRVAACS